MRSDPQSARRRDEPRRRPDDRVGALELAELHDRHGEVDVDGEQPVAPRGRLFDEHRALQQPVPAEGIEKPYGSAAVARDRAALSTARSDATWVASDDITGSTRIATTPRPRRPTSPAPTASRSASRIRGACSTTCSRRNGDLYQNYQTIDGVLSAEYGHGVQHAGLVGRAARTRTSASTARTSGRSTASPSRSAAGGNT